MVNERGTLYSVIEEFMLFKNIRLVNVIGLKCQFRACNVVSVQQCHLSVLRKHPFMAPSSREALHIFLLINIDWSSIAQAFSPFTGLTTDPVSS
jgi:hypothetical protein